MPNIDSRPPPWTHPINWDPWLNQRDTLGTKEIHIFLQLLLLKFFYDDSITNYFGGPLFVEPALHWNANRDSRPPPWTYLVNWDPWLNQRDTSATV